MTTTYWKERGLCYQTGVDPAIFLYPKRKTRAERHEHDTAQRICAACEVQDICVLEEEAPGIWGGLGKRERMEAARARRRDERGGAPHPNMERIEAWRRSKCATTIATVSPGPRSSVER